MMKYSTPNKSPKLTAHKKLNTLERFFKITSSRKPKYSFDDQESNTFLKDVLLSHYHTSRLSSIERNDRSDEILQNSKSNAFLQENHQLMSGISSEKSPNKDIVRNVTQGTARKYINKFSSFSSPENRNKTTYKCFQLGNEQCQKLSAFSMNKSKEEGSFNFIVDNSFRHRKIKSRK